MGRVAGDTKPRRALAHPIPGIPPRGDPETQKTDPEDKNLASWKAGMGRNGPSEGSWEAGRRGRTEVGTWRCKLLMRQVTPNPTSRKLVRVKALMALVIFWILR